MDENDKNIDITKYRRMINSFSYLTAIRLDIIFYVCLYACFQACLKESHVTTVKYIF